ncbi:unnamed protein product [Mytilus coruscus]|uniref:Uncharacterized protein n=1 Tax=Mytilus coruscus TaxID=42192 RepID=A0A6J8ESC0_MYTCO|nr:unnamed protein product [Mytilus coruscus]
MNSVILQALRPYTQDQQDDLYVVLPGILMVSRATPATQSTDYSPFYLLYGREITLPIDTALIPKDRLAQDHKVFLSRILQNLETSRKIAAQNIEQAQERYKQQYDKKSKEPEFQPAQRVWHYCTKVTVGKAPKLHRKWSGPYYTTCTGPHSTYKLRNCATNKEVQSMMDAQRLKPYCNQKDRPTNIPDPFQGNEDKLDPEEPQDNNIIEEHPPMQNNRQQPVPTTNNNDNDRQQLPIPIIINKRSDQDQQQHDVLRLNNRQLQNQQTGETNRKNPADSGNPTAKAPVKDNTPSCQDCNNNKCKVLREENIQQVQSSIEVMLLCIIKLNSLTNQEMQNGIFHAKSQQKIIFTKPGSTIYSVNQISTKIMREMSTQTESFDEQDPADENEK